MRVCPRLSSAQFARLSGLRATSRAWDGLDFFECQFVAHRPMMGQVERKKCSISHSAKAQPEASESGQGRMEKPTDRFLPRVLPMGRGKAKAFPKRLFSLL